MAYEYRVRYVREGGSVKSRVYQQRHNAERFMRLIGPEPWTGIAEFAGRDPDELWCCPGTAYHECGCGGATVREVALDKREHIPALITATLQRREVGAWETVPEKEEKRDGR